jgi:serine/threonine protein kinase
MAPELLSGGAYGESVDVYAAGVMINEMLTRQVGGGDVSAWALL